MKLLTKVAGVAAGFVIAGAINSKPVQKYLNKGPKYARLAVASQVLASYIMAGVTIATIVVIANELATPDENIDIILEDLGITE